MLALDIETSGLPDRKGYNAYYDPNLLQHYESSRVVSIGMIFDDITYYFIVKPNGFTITNSAFHGITQEMAEKEGQSIQDIFTPELIEKIKRTDIVIAHNIYFDWYVLRSELIRCGVDDPFKYSLLYCTMCEGKKHFNLRKPPKLIELYKLCYNKEPVNLHNALNDAQYALECYNKINKLHN